METVEGKVAPKKNNYGKVVCFLLLEILAVVSFSLGSSFLFFTIVSIVILGLIIATTFKQIKSDGIASIGIFLFPVIIFAVLSALSYFKYDPYFILNNSALLFFVPISLTCFAATGYFVNLTGSFKIHHALIVIYSGIALLTFLNFLVTMIQFVPFYTLKYVDSYYYYDGYPSPEPIGNMGYFLMNFSMVEVSLSYFTYYPMVLLTAFLPLGHMKFKENKKLFIAYLCFGLLGLITIIFTINKITLLVLFGVALIIGLIALFTKFNINTKPLKIGSNVLVVLLGLGFLFLFLNAQDSVGYQMRVGFIRNITEGNSLFNRLFNANRFVSGYNSILDGLFASKTIDGNNVMLKLFGFPLNGGYSTYFGQMTWPIRDSNSFFFDSFITSGLFGTLFLVLFLILGIRRVIKYYTLSTDDKRDKVTILGFVFVSIAYALVNFDSTPFVFSDTIIPFYMNNIFFIDLFLFAYCFFNSQKKKEEPKEEVLVDEK